LPESQIFNRPSAAADRPALAGRAPLVGLAISGRAPSFAVIEQAVRQIRNNSAVGRAQFHTAPVLRSLTTSPCSNGITKLQRLVA